MSLGVQSFDDASLAVLGRLHDGQGARDAVARVHQAGFEHVSLDLIVGAPGVPPGVPVADARIAADLVGIDHVSTYDLTWEPGTAYVARRARGTLTPWSDDALADASLAVDEVLQQSGFERYEVSNHARPGGRAVHNAAYWVGDDYLGLGVGAHSLRVDGGVMRRANGRNPRRYLSDPHGEASFDPVSPTTHVAELVMTGLRTSDGVDLDGLERRFGRAALDVRVWAEAARIRGWVDVFDNRIVPTEAGLRFCDAVALDALDRIDVPAERLQDRSR